MRKSFTSLLVLAAMLAGTTTTWAQLYVCGKEVPTTGTTVQSVTGNGISGTVTYDPQNKYLTLKDATITANGNDGIWNKGVEDLRILLEGTVKITTSSDGTNVAGIYCSKNTTISRLSGVHTPTVTVSNTGAGPAVKSTNGAEVEFFAVNATVTASNHHAIYADNAATLVVMTSTLTAKTNSSSHYAIAGFTSGLATTFSDCPLEVFSSGYHKFDTNTGRVVQNGTPVQSTTLVPSIMIGDEALSYQTPRINTTTTGASSVSGSVSFSPGANPWLELDNFSMTDKGIICRIPNLKVRIKGTNTITGHSQNSNVFEIYDNTTFTGAGSLYLYAYGSGASAISTYRNANVTFCINDIIAQGMKYGFYGQPSGTLTLEKYSSSSRYRFLGANCNVYTGKLVMDGMDIWNYHTYFNAKECKIWDLEKNEVACGTNVGSDGTWFKSSSEFTYYPIYVGGTHVNNRNYSNVTSPYITGGKVSYDIGNKKLTLDGVQLEATGTDAPNGIYVGTGLDGLTLNFSGADQHWTTDKEVFDLSSTTTISGNCLRVYLTSNKESGITTRAGASVTINTTGYLGSKGAKYGYYGNAATDEVLKLSKTTEDTFGYDFEGAEGAIRTVRKLQLDNMDFAYIDGLTCLPGCYFDEANKRVSQNGGSEAKGKVTFMSIKENLPIYVAGKQLNVTRSDCSIYVGSPYITSGPKSVKYVPSTKTLTLADATTVGHGNNNTVTTCGIAVQCERVTIDVVGTNNITAGNFGIWANKDLTIGGSGNLNVTSTETGALGINDIVNERTLTLQCSGGVHTFQGKTYGFCGWSTANLAIKKASGRGALYKFAGESADIGQTKNLDLGDGVRLHSRFTWFNEEKKAMYRYDAVSKNSDIAEGTWIRGDVEWIDYPLYICGHQLYGAYVDGNLKGPASGFCCKEYGGKGIWYDPDDNILYLSGDCTYDDWIVESYIEDLTMSVEDNSTLTGKSGVSIIRLYANTTITGGKLTLKSEAEDNDALGIFISESESLTIKDADIEIVGDGFKYGITGESDCSLIIDNSDISVSAHNKGCISDWGGITLTKCRIEQPKGAIVKAYGIYDADDHLIGSGADTETLVIKAGKIKGDVNGDGDVNTADVTAVYGYIINGNLSGFAEEDANVNGDSDVNSADVVAIYSIIIGGSSGSQRVYEMLLEMEE